MDNSNNKSNNNDISTSNTSNTYNNKNTIKPHYYNSNNNSNNSRNNSNNNDLFYKVWSNLFLNNIIKRKLKTYQIFNNIKINLNESYFQSPYREYVKNLVYEYFIHDNSNNNSSNNENDKIISENNNNLIKYIPQNIKSLHIIILSNNLNNRQQNNNSEIIIIPNSIESIRLITNSRFINIKLKLGENLVKLDLSTFNCPIQFEQLLENLKEIDKLRVLLLNNQSFREFSLPTSLVELDCGSSKQKYLPGHFPIGLKKLKTSIYFNQPLLVNREIYETILKSTFSTDQALPYFNNCKLFPDNLETIIFENLFNQSIDSVLPKSLTSLRFTNNSDFNQPILKDLPVNLTNIRFGSWFDQDIDFKNFSNVKTLKFGSSFQRYFNINVCSGINIKLEKLAFKNSYESNQNITTNTFKDLPEFQLKSLYLSSHQTVEPNSIPNGIKSIKNYNWSMIHLLPNSVNKLKYDDLINIPNNNETHQIPSNIKSLSILGFKESSSGLASTNIQHLQVGGKILFRKLSSSNNSDNSSIKIIDNNKLPLKLKSLILNEEAVLRSLNFNSIPSTLIALSINKIKLPSPILNSINSNNNINNNNNNNNNDNHNLLVNLKQITNLKILELGPNFNYQDVSMEWLPPNLSVLIIKNRTIQIESPSTLPSSLCQIYINSQSIIINQFNEYLPILLDKLYVFDINSKYKLKLFKKVLKEYNSNIQH